jgi:predicted RNase H-like nuclease (RuvC/YqgF family)
MLEEENQELKQEIERLNYRYNLLKASIDTVEYKIQNEYKKKKFY